jgi:aminoglycoside phosphotransferase (APT) family kinase protein
MGHSAETLLLTVHWKDGDGDRRLDVCIRARPAGPGLLEPYDLRRQFDVLRGLETTAVRAPRVWWIEPSDHILGQEFYVMERLPGLVYERGVPAGLVATPSTSTPPASRPSPMVVTIWTVRSSTGPVRSDGCSADRFLLLSD